MGKGATHYTSLLEAPSSLFLNTWDGESTNLLGTLGCGVQWNNLFSGLVVGAERGSSCSWCVLLQLPSLSCSCAPAHRGDEPHQRKKIKLLHRQTQKLYFLSIETAVWWQWCYPTVVTAVWLKHSGQEEESMVWQALWEGVPQARFRSVATCNLCVSYEDLSPYFYLCDLAARVP